MDIDFGSSIDLQDSAADALFGVDKENDVPDQADDTCSRRSSIIPNFMSNLTKRAAERRSFPKSTRAAVTSSPRRLKRCRRDLSTESMTDCTFSSFDGTETVQRKKTALDRVQSITSLSGRRISSQGVDLSPAKKTRVSIKGYQPPTPQKARPKAQQLWSNTVQSGEENLDEAALRRQEAIYEIYMHASSMLSDTKTVVDNYDRPMTKLGLLSEDESRRLFGDLYTFPVIHQSIVDKMAAQRDVDTGKTEQIGATLMETLPTLKALVPFCSELQLARDVYDNKLQDQNVKDFLDRCRTCAFSNRRSLWDLLDSQRSSLLKYPLLLKQLIKVTPLDHMDVDDLSTILKDLQDMVFNMDNLAGSVKCQQALSRLQYANGARCPIVDASRQVLCSGPLKLTMRNNIVEVFLFDRAMVVTRKHQRQGSDPAYQVLYNPIYTYSMRLTDNPAIKEPINGSFRSLRSTHHSQEICNVFRIERTTPPGMLFAKDRATITLTAPNSHDAKIWTQAIGEAITASFDRTAPPPRPMVTKKVSKSTSAVSLPAVITPLMESYEPPVTRNNSRRSLK